MMTILKRVQFWLFPFINSIPKRLRVLVATLIMAALLTTSTFFEFTQYFLFWVFMLIFFSYLLTFFAIHEGIEKSEWLMLFIMPVFFSVTIYLFYSLFPVRWLTRLPLLVVYILGFYAVLLSGNIFNVGVEKSLQLYRAAFTINFLMQTVLVFLLMQVLIALRLPFFINAFLGGVIVFPLISQLTWTVRLNHEFDKNLLPYSFFLSLLIIELLIVLSFLPLPTTIISLSVAAVYYAIGGIIYHYLDQRLFINIVREYAVVLVFIFLVVLLSLQW